MLPRNDPITLCYVPSTDPTRRAQGKRYRIAMSAYGTIYCSCPDWREKRKEQQREARAYRARTGAPWRAEEASAAGISCKHLDGFHGRLRPPHATRQAPIPRAVRENVYQAHKAIGRAATDQRRADLGSNVRAYCAALESPEAVLAYFDALTGHDSSKPWGED